MRILPTLTKGLCLAVLAAAPAFAGDMKLHPYATSVNYCPAGLQPIVMAGVICCGQPNTQMSYQQVMRHPVRATKARHYSARANNCPVGAKGCS